MLQSFQVHELAAPLLRHLSYGIEEKIDDVILGNVTGPGGNIGRLSALEAGLPLSVPGLTLDRQCSAGLEAIRLASYLIQAGAGSCYIAGGAESTSTSTFPKRAKFSPVSIGDPEMVEAADMVAKKYLIAKEQQDEYALLSFERSWESAQRGFFEEEILPLNEHHQDEAFIKKRNLTKIIQRSKPLYQDGTVTAANSCGIQDGASAALVMEENFALHLGFKPVLRFVDSQVSGVHPFHPAAAPIPAIQSLLARNQLTIDDINLFEINEAFAAKILACSQELSIPLEKINVSGGALTIGHPYGASGAILVTRLFYEVQRKDSVNYVLAAIGSGGGIGVAVLFQTIK